MARKQKTIHYIYKTTCLITNRYYIGMHSTSNLNDGYMGSGKRLRYSIRKHGIDNHKKEILEFFETRELLIEGEKKAITPEMIEDKNCMNLKHGGEGGFINDEHKQKLFASIIKSRNTYRERLAKDPSFREKHIKNAKKNFMKGHLSGKIKYDTFTGKKHSEETKKLMSDKAKTYVGNKNSQYGTCWITKDGFNKKIKKETLDDYIKEGWVSGRKIK